MSILTGKTAEKFASSFLKKNGFKDIKLNYRSKFGEIDIIACDRDVLCFIEVKFRKNRNYGLPEEFVDIKKQKKIVKTALCYIAEKKIDDMNFRFDVVAVEPGENGKLNARLIKNAFEASLYDN
jgi:putative endonuclease